MTRNMKKPAAVLVLILIITAATAAAFAGSVPFTDVSETEPYYDAVVWAYENNVTKGITTELFSPGATCTRGQVVTFLWNANGRPDVLTENPFKDISGGRYYYKAVLWAYTKGIVAGTSADMFSPDKTCTKEQIITFLWRSLGRPASSPDTVTDCSNYAKSAVAFLQEQGIAGSIKGTEDCPRADIVYYIYKCKDIKLHRPGDVTVKGPDEGSSRSIGCTDCGYGIECTFAKTYEPADGTPALLNAAYGEYFIFVNGDFWPATVTDGRVYVFGDDLGPVNMPLYSPEYILYHWVDNGDPQKPGTDLLSSHGSREWEQALADVKGY